MAIFLLNSDKYYKYVRWWLTFVLCLVPFKFYILQQIGFENIYLLGLIRNFDLLTIIILFPISLIMIYQRGSHLLWLSICLLISVIVICLMGLLSGIVNGNSFFITSYGTFVYVQNFLVIFIFAAFVRELDEVKKIFMFMLAVALIITILGLIDALWALLSRYILDKDIYDNGIYLFKNNANISIVSSYWRFGVFRASAFMSTPIIFGLYSLFFLVFYSSIVEKRKMPVMLLFIAGCFLSISRIAYMGMVIFFGWQIMKGKKRFLCILIPLGLIMVYMSAMPDFNRDTLQSDMPAVSDHIAVDMLEDIFRDYAREKAIAVWSDHPFLGVGPGMFGGVISVKYQSPVYSEYNFPISNQNLKRIWGIDQFWFQYLAEMGIVGIAAFAGFIITLVVLFYSLYRKAGTYELRGLFEGLVIFTLVVVIYPFGIKLNVVSVLFSFSALAGMGLGCSDQKKNDIT